MTRICAALQAAGIEVWFDQSELRGGDAWDAKIRRQIKECALFVAVISANTETRPKGYFRREWKQAVDCTHDLADDVPFLVPIAIDATAEATARVPEKFREFQWTRLPDGQPTPAFVEHLKRLLAARATGTHAHAAPSEAKTDTGDSASSAGPVASRATPAVAVREKAAPSRAIPVAPMGRSERRGMPWPMVGIGAAALVAVTLYFGRALTPQPTSAEIPTTRLELSPPHQRFAFYPAPAVSPDGRQVAFWAPDEAGKVGLWVRSLESTVARLLPGTAGGLGLPAFWSPDGRSLGFFADKKLKRIDLAGGNPIVLADAVNPRGGSWSVNGDIVFVPNPGKPAYRISAAGGEATAMNLSTKPGFSVRFPHFLPDGQHFLLTGRSAAADDGVFVASLDGKEPRLLSKARSRMEYAGGHVFFGQAGSLFAQRFDEHKLALSGEPFRVAENLGFSFGDPRSFAFSVSVTGTIVCWSGPHLEVTQLTWFSRAGQRIETVGEPGEHAGFALSPTQQQVILERHDPKLGETNLWLWDIATKLGYAFTSGPNQGDVPVIGTPVWSPAGDRVLFSTFPGLCAQALRGGEQEKLFDDRGWLCDVSPDGRFALFAKSDPMTGYDLWLLPLAGEKIAKPFLATKQNEWVGRFSPDGRWVAYASDEKAATRAEIYVQSFPVLGRPVRISREGGGRPQWRHDGKELYFLNNDGKLLAATVDGGGETFQVTTLPQVLFATKTPTDSSRQQYQPSNDGERFLVNAQVEDAVPRQLTVVLNWKPPVQKN